MRVVKGGRQRVKPANPHKTIVADSGQSFHRSRASDNVIPTLLR